MMDNITVTERTPPHDVASEMALVGSMLLDPEVIGSVYGIIESSDAFFSRRNQIIFEGILELFQASAPVDGVTLTHKLKQKDVYEAAGGFDYLEQLVNCVPSAANALAYAQIVRDKALLRRLITACTQTLESCYDNTKEAAVILDRSERTIFEVAQLKVVGQPVSLTDVLHQTFEMLDRNTGNTITGVATGYVELDNLTSGLQRGEMIVLAARPSVGKTALAMNIVEHVGVDLKKPVAVFSLEMSRQQLAQRMLCSRSGVDSQNLRRNMLSREDRNRLSMAVGELSEGKIFIDDTAALSILDLRTKARRLLSQHRIELVVIDYLQLMEAPREENRQQQISTISRGVKALARELDCPVMCLSQLNRSSEQDGRLPRTSDLRESGSIEQDADVVMLLHREAVMHRGDQDWAQNNPDQLNAAQLIIAKQRNGPCDTVRLTFISANTRFETYHPGVEYQ
ncbi:MAG: replicative DNA helicase [Phycisphaerae bacterium]